MRPVADRRSQHVPWEKLSRSALDQLRPYAGSSVLPSSVLPGMRLTERAVFQPQAAQMGASTCFLKASVAGLAPLMKSKILMPRVLRHAVGIAKNSDPSLQNQPIDARQHASNLIAVSSYQFHHRHDGKRITRDAATDATPRRRSSWFRPVRVRERSRPF